ncbi:unnamed protein product [Amoebophrya sp. A120]|nr:unnamed protein product [Amoebophrya sp. A120]|eukprot:GSA120T00023948001.1
MVDKLWPKFVNNLVKTVANTLQDHALKGKAPEEDQVPEGDRIDDEAGPERAGGSSGSFGANAGPAPGRGNGRTAHGVDDAKTTVSSHPEEED